MKIRKMAIAVTFHFDEGRLKFLRKTVSQFHLFADDISLHIFTNEQDELKKDKILQSIKEEVNVDIRIHVPTYLGHPFFLTWSHLNVFRELYFSDDSISHFLYVEDDIYLTLKNIDYWLRGREIMRSNSLIPGFMRYELRLDSSDLYATDITRSVMLNKLPRINNGVDYCFLNLPEPYQGMYFLDRELMLEHLNGPSSIPEDSPWGIREKAAAGLTFSRIPRGCHSRHFIGYDLINKRIDPDSLVHHLPNNYANGTSLRTAHLGRVKVSEVII